MQKLSEPAKAKKACTFCRKKKVKCCKDPHEAQCDNCKKRNLACQFGDPQSGNGITKAWKWQNSSSLHVGHNMKESINQYHDQNDMNPVIDINRQNMNASMNQTDVPNRELNFGPTTELKYQPILLSHPPQQQFQDQTQISEPQYHHESRNIIVPTSDAGIGSLEYFNFNYDVDSFERQLEANIGKLFDIDFEIPDLTSNDTQQEDAPEPSPSPSSPTTRIKVPSKNIHNGKRPSISMINSHTQTTEDLYNLFFFKKAYLADMINQEKFKDNIRRNTPMTLILSDAILAQTHLYLNSPKRASTYYFKARLSVYKFLDDEEFISSSFYSVATIQILLVLTDYELKVGKWVSSGLTFARAVMLTKMRGLYVYDVENPFSLNKRDDDEYQRDGEESIGWPEWMVREEIRRTFFKVFCYDKYITLFKGVNESLPFDRVLVRLPLETSLKRDAMEPKFSKKPFIRDVLPRIKDGERLIGLGSISVHIIFLSMVSCANKWIRTVCMNEGPIDEIMLNSNLTKMNEITLQLECINNNFEEQFELYNKLGKLVRNITNLKLIHAMIFVIGKLLKHRPNEFSSAIDDIYYNLKTQCLSLTILLISVFDQIDLSKLVTYNPFCTLALHCSIKSAIQLFIISKQRNCTHLEGSKVQQLSTGISKVINQLGNLEARAPLLNALILFYNDKLESYDKDPYDNIFFEDTLLFK